MTFATGRLNIIFPREWRFTKHVRNRFFIVQGVITVYIYVEILAGVKFGGWPEISCKARLVLIIGGS